MNTDPTLALKFCESLYEELHRRLSDISVVHRRLVEIAAHSQHQETLFCKGCVLPIVDLVTSRFLSSELSLQSKEIHASLRCEGISNLHQIYSPSIDQSGFSTFTWGENFQRVSKTGKKYPSDSRGYQPCPDFGIVHRGKQKFSILGETKFSRNACSATSLLSSVKNDLLYYIGLPKEEEKNWDYDYGFGIVYAAGGFGVRQSMLITDYWQSHRFVMAAFYA